MATSCAAYPYPWPAGGALPRSEDTDKLPLTPERRRTPTGGKAPPPLEEVVEGAAMAEDGPPEAQTPPRACSTAEGEELSPRLAELASTPALVQLAARPLRSTSVSRRCVASPESLSTASPQPSALLGDAPELPRALVPALPGGAGAADSPGGPEYFDITDTAPPAGGPATAMGPEPEASSVEALAAGPTGSAARQAEDLHRGCSPARAPQTLLEAPLAEAKRAVAASPSRGRDPPPCPSAPRLGSSPATLALLFTVVWVAGFCMGTWNARAEVALLRDELRHMLEELSRRPSGQREASPGPRVEAPAAQRAGPPTAAAPPAAPGEPSAADIGAASDGLGPRSVPRALPQEGAPSWHLEAEDVARECDADGAAHDSLAAGEAHGPPREGLGEARGSAATAGRGDAASQRFPKQGPCAGGPEECGIGPLASGHAEGGADAAPEGAASQGERVSRAMAFAGRMSTAAPGQLELRRCARAPPA